MILVLTNEHDLHAHAVIAWFELWGTPYFRFHPDELAVRYELVADSAADPRQGVTVKDLLTGQCFCSAQISCVWNRRGLPPRIHPEADPECGRFFAAELDAALNLIYASLQTARWVNPPSAVTVANDKWLQLNRAKEVGLRTPSTTVTNSPQRAFDFYREQNQACVVKTFRQVPANEQRLFTHKLDANLTLESFADVAAAPVILQEFIPKKYDLRVTVVGTEVFACRIHSQEHEATMVDFRAADIDEIGHELVDLPRDFIEQMVSYSNILGLQSCEFDFVEVESGPPVFLECNPNGQWLWIEILCRVDIAKSMAILLSNGE